MSIPEMTLLPPRRRLLGPAPKIGIRPTVDGRLGGVRESLEAQAMGLAQAVARLLSEELRHADGLPVECVIAERCIGGAAEAAAAAAQFEAAGVGVSITVTPCWCYGSETMDLHPSWPKAVWGFNGTERPGAVYLAAVLAAHAQKGLPAFSIYGRDVQDAGDTRIPPDVRDRLLQFARAALAVATMRGTSYLSLGGISMGILGSLVDHDFFQRYLGMRVEAVDMSEVLRRIQRAIFDPLELDAALQWIRRHCREGKDYNASPRSRIEKDEDWRVSAQMALIMRDLMVGNPRLAELGHGEEALGRNALLAGFQGQRQWTDFMPNGDFMEAMLNSTFDWSGIRAPYLVATENDALNGVAMMFGHLLSGSAQIFADVRTYWSAEAVERVSGQAPLGRAAGGFLHLINSGPAALDGTGRQEIDGAPAMKPWWRVAPEEATRCLEATTWHPADLGYFRGGGWSTRFTTRGEMPVTLSRVNLVAGVGPVLQIAEGHTVELPEAVHRILDERTNPTWPTTWFVPRITGSGAFTDVYNVMANWGANHGAFSYGHVGHELITLAAMLRIPVAMHNVDPHRIFRPHAWAGFGTAGPEAADFRACAAHGPLYR